MPPKPAIIRAAEPCRITGTGTLAWTFMPGFRGGGANNPATISQEGVFPSSSNATSYSLPVAIGSAAPNRFVLACIALRNNSGSNSISSCIFDGVAATPVSGAVINTGGSGVAFGGMFILHQPTDTVIPIVVNVSSVSGSTGIGIGTFAIYGLIKGGLPSDVATSTGGSPTTVSLDVEAGGVAAAFMSISTGTHRTYTWSGLTEGYDQQVESGFQDHTGASGAFVDAVTGQSISVTESAGTSNRAMIAASFR
jgi:hypothetical protein